eukprot:TRINITY_DN4721_c0_g1_i3.p1 TRINITY_DN4721_c0_g1~~TRINITY_DN4721_c0_g1_i3.p1  ORF type:complete len:358 (+),score=105.10 TRINITY_DN4721_c0_g1_i3:161-1234(+)
MRLSLILCASLAAGQSPADSTTTLSRPAPATPEPEVRQQCSAYFTRAVKRYETCLAGTAVENLLGCSCDKDADPRECEWLRNLGALHFLGAVREGCKALRKFPYTRQTSRQGAVSPEFEECEPDVEKFSTCLHSRNGTVWDMSSRQDECECAEDAMEDLFDINCASYLDAVLPPADNQTYFDPAEACGCRNETFGEQSCLPPIRTTEWLPPHPQALELVSKLQLNETNATAWTLHDLKDVFQTAIATEAQVEPVSKVTVLTVRKDEEKDGIVVWFRISGLEKNTSAAIQDRLEAALESESSWLRRELLVEPGLNLIEDAFAQRVKTVTVVEEKEETPSWAIALLVIFSVSMKPRPLS